MTLERGESRGGDAPAGTDILGLRLYVAGDGPNSAEARTNLATILAGVPATQYRLEIVDFLREPQRALKDGVIVTPTLVRITPPPTCRIIGTLRETPKVLAVLGIAEPRNV